MESGGFSSWRHHMLWREDGTKGQWLADWKSILTGKETLLKPSHMDKHLNAFFFARVWRPDPARRDRAAVWTGPATV